MKSLKHCSSFLWCIAGDFNDILAFGDKRDRIQQLVGLIQFFRQAVEFCALHDLGYCGNRYTWERGRDKLDRALSTLHWRSLFPAAKVFNLDTAHSDYSALFLALGVTVITYAPKQFRFENAWLREVDVSQAVQDGWTTGRSQSIMEQIRSCGLFLQQWGQDK